MKNITITDIIAIISLIVGIIQTIKTTQYKKIFDYPYFEYDTGESRRYRILSKYLWQVLFLTIFSFLLIAFALERKYAYFGLYYKKAIAISGVALVISTFVKDWFHNVIVFKQKFEMFYKKHCDSLKTLYDLIFYLIIMLILPVSSMILGDTNKIKSISLIIIVIILSSFMVAFRSLSEASDYLHGYAVKELKIVLKNDQCFDQLSLYEDLKSVIRIRNNDTIYYIEKSNISLIEKKLDSECIIYRIKEKLENDKKEK